MKNSLYRTLLTGADLATWADDKTSLAETWTSQAAKLKTAINKYCWDQPYGAFKDNASTTSLHPQDANSMAIFFGVVGSTSPQAASISNNLLKNWTPIGAETPELPGNISPFISSFEIQAHLTIGETDRALELIRRSWGWYQNNANGTGSTVIEGYLTNGSFSYRSSRGYDYDASYVSHSHGWSSGPTSALTNYILGLSVTSPAGASWRLAPQFGDLKSVEGGFVTKLGKYQASWQVESWGYTISFSVPKGTTGQLVLPCLTIGKLPSVKLDGSLVNGKLGSHGGSSSSTRKRDEVGDGSVVLVTADGGSHTVIVQ